MKIKKKFELSRCFAFFCLIVFSISIIFLHPFPTNLSLNLIFTAFAIFFPISCIILIYFSGSKDLHNDKLNNQTNLIEGLISELKVSEDNIHWYQTEIEKNNFTSLDHLINKIHIENYLCRLNGKFFNKEGFAKISNINDKIIQLNTHISESRNLYLNFNLRQIPSQKRFNKNYCLSIIKEVLEKIDNLKKELGKQKKKIEKIII